MILAFDITMLSFYILTSFLNEEIDIEHSLDTKKTVKIKKCPKIGTFMSSWLSPKNFNKDTISPALLFAL